MRYSQLTEAKVTGQQFYDTLVSLGIKTNRDFFTPDELKAAKAKLGIRLYPQEFRDAKDSHGYVLIGDLKGLDTSKKPVVASNNAPKQPIKQEPPKVEPKVDLANKPVEIKQQSPKGIEKVAHPTATLTTEDVVREMFSKIKYALYDAKNRYAEYRKDDECVSVRYWGEWEVPEGEEDDGDYDWEVLSDKSSKELDSILPKIEADLPEGWKLRVQTGEKNWIYFFFDKK